MNEENLNQIAKQKIKHLFNEIKDKDMDFESELIEKIRIIAPKVYFIPFLEQLVQELKESNKTINSKYVLKILLAEENLLFNRDYLGSAGASYSYKGEEIFFIDKTKDVFLIKGSIFYILETLNLNEIIQYIKDEILKKYSVGGSDTEVVYIYDFLEKQKILEQINKEFQNKNNKEKLIISINARD